MVNPPTPPAAMPELPLGRAPIAWRPTEAHRARSRLLRFMKQHDIITLDELQRRSVADVAWFWDAVVRDLGLEFFAPYHSVVDLSRGRPWPRWFVGGRYNYVHNALDRHARDATKAGQTALVWEGEDGAVRTLSYADLLAATDRLAWGLRGLGISPGDRVGIFMPMPVGARVGTTCSGRRRPGSG